MYCAAVTAIEYNVYNTIYPRASIYIHARERIRVYRSQIAGCVKCDYSRDRSCRLARVVAHSVQSAGSSSLSLSTAFFVLTYFFTHRP